MTALSSLAPGRHDIPPAGLPPPELGIRSFDFLKTHDIGPGFAKPIQQARQATVDVVDIEIGDLHRRPDKANVRCMVVIWLKITSGETQRSDCLRAFR
jgi:hypothetical protein